MEKILNKAALFFIIILIGVVGLLYHRDNQKKAVINEQKRLLNECYQIINTKPDTIVVKDTIIFKEKVYIKGTIQANEPHPEAKIFVDSLFNDEIRAKVLITANKVFNINWEYEPILKEKVTEIIKYAPVEVEKIVYKENNNISAVIGIHYINRDIHPFIGIQKNNSKFVYGLNLSYNYAGAYAGIVISK